MAEIKLGRPWTWEAIPMMWKVLAVLGATAVLGGTAINLVQTQIAVPAQVSAQRDSLTSHSKRMDVIERNTSELKESLESFKAMWRCVILADLDGKSSRPCLILN